MPRKRKSTTGEVRDQIIHVRSSPTERDYLQQRAGALSMSEYLLKAGLGEKIPQRRKRQPVPTVNRLTYVELGRIGININQLAKACNTALLRGSGCNMDPVQLKALAEKLEQVRLEVIAADPEEEDSEAGEAGE